MSSRSESASSRFTICAFSHLSALLGLRARPFTMTANNTRKIATPANTIVVINAACFRMGVQISGSGNCGLPDSQLDRLRRLLSRNGKGANQIFGSGIGRGWRNTLTVRIGLTASFFSRTFLSALGVPVPTVGVPRRPTARRKRRSHPDQGLRFPRFAYTAAA